jgi:hypothetical protein
LIVVQQIVVKIGALVRPFFLVATRQNPLFLVKKPVIFVNLSQSIPVFFELYCITGLAQT